MDRSLLLTAAVSALLGGVAGALTTVAMVREEPPRARKEIRVQAPEPEPEPTSTALVDRVASLERAVGRLRAANPGAALGRPAGSAAPGSPAALEAAGADPVVDSPVFEAAVRDVVDRLEEERESEREVERAERRKQWAEQWSGELGGQLGLNEAQKVKVREIAANFFERLRDLRRSGAGQPGSRDEWRERMSALRSEAEGKLGEVLDPGQMSRYQTLDSELKLGARFGGRGRNNRRAEGN